MRVSIFSYVYWILLFFCRLLISLQVYFSAEELLFLKSIWESSLESLGAQPWFIVHSADTLLVTYPFNFAIAAIIPNLDLFMRWHLSTIFLMAEWLLSMTSRTLEHLAKILWSLSLNTLLNWGCWVHWESKGLFLYSRCTVTNTEVFDAFKGYSDLSLHPVLQQTPTGCPLLQFTAVTIYLQINPTDQGLGP